MNFPQTGRQTKSTKYSFLYNDFDWLNQDSNPDFTVQSLITSAPFFNMKSDLKILGELNSEYKDLGFDLLVQRDIDKERVDIEIIENYLMAEGKTNFFPPIVVALIPSYKTIKDKDFKSSFGKNGENINITIGDSAITQDFMSSTTKNYGSEGEIFDDFFHSDQLKFGQIQWDLQKFHGIVIDGQHRFHALREFAKRNNTPDLSQCFFPVNFVIITPKPEKTIHANQYIRVARELFIDINKNAKQVSHTRQILLDDLDLIRFITRNSIKQYNITEEGLLFDWKIIAGTKHLPKIPQALVAWNKDMSENDKVNIKSFDLAQITSTALIYKILDDFIFTAYDQDEKNNIFNTMYRVIDLKDFVPQKGSKEEGFFASIESKKKDFTRKIKDLDEQIQLSANENYEGPFDKEYYERKKTILNTKALTFEPKVNAWLSNRFFEETMYGKVLTMFYSRFKPYQRIILELEPFFDNERYKSVINHLIDPNPRFSSASDYTASIRDEVVKGDFISFYERIEGMRREFMDIRYTVFQRAVFADLRSVIDLLDKILPKAKPEEQIARYIDSLSRLYEIGILSKDLEIKFSKPLFKSSVEDDFKVKSAKVWLNVWLNDRGDTIKYRNPDAVKINDLLRIFVAAEILNKNLEELILDLGTRISKPLSVIERLYRSAYEKQIKSHFDLRNIRQAQDKIKNPQRFDLDLTSIVSETIDNVILIKES